MKIVHFQISWFRSNKTSFRPRFSLIAIGALLLPEFAALNRFQLLSSHQSKSRLIIGPVHNEDQGFYRCKSTSHGHHTINLNVRSNFIVELRFWFLIEYEKKILVVSLSWKMNDSWTSSLAGISFTSWSDQSNVFHNLFIAMSIIGRFERTRLAEERIGFE